jgi:thioredoxin reductase (NADPH)
MKGFKSPLTTDVVIIGAGPVGLFAIFECGMMKLKTHVIDTLAEVGGQCIALYPEKPIYDIPAHPKILAADLIENLKKQAEPFDPLYHLDQQVTQLEKTTLGWRVQTSKNISIDCKAIIIAAGVGAFGPNRPPLTDIEKYENKSVFYFVKNKEFFRGKKIVIAGGGDSAVDWALNLVDIAKHITVVHRRPKFRAALESVSRLYELSEKGRIDLAIPYQLDSLQGEGTALHTVGLKTLEGEGKIVEADALLAFFGLSMNLGPLAEWGLNLEKSHISVDIGTYQTSAPGIFAIGDVATYPTKQKLILTGFSEAASVAYQIRSLIYPGEVFHFQYSTTQGVPEHNQ